MSHKKILLIAIFFVASATTTFVNAAARAEAKRPDLETLVKQSILSLPSAPELKKYLAEIGLESFAEKTNIHGELGDKEKSVIQIAMAVILAINHYNETSQNSAMATYLEKRKLDIIKCILQDSPVGIEELTMLDVSVD